MIGVLVDAGSWGFLLCGPLALAGALVWRFSPGLAGRLFSAGVFAFFLGVASLQWVHLLRGGLDVKAVALGIVAFPFLLAAMVNVVNPRTLLGSLGLPSRGSQAAAVVFVAIFTGVLTPAIYRTVSARLEIRRLAGGGVSRLTVSDKTVDNPVFLRELATGLARASSCETQRSQCSRPVRCRITFGGGQVREYLVTTYAKELVFAEPGWGPGLHQALVSSRELYEHGVAVFRLR